MPEPTTGEWIVAGVAAGLVVVVAALLLLRPALARRGATAWGRAAGLLLAAAAAGLVLVVTVTVVANDRADDAPAGAFVGVLVGQPGTAGRIAGYAAALLLPLAAVLAVLAVAVVDLGRPSGFRLAAGVAAGFVLLVGFVVVAGDVGPAATGVGWTAALLGGGAALLLAVDERAGVRQSRSSDSSTTSSQRSLQSRQR